MAEYVSKLPPEEQQAPDGLPRRMAEYRLSKRPCCLWRKLHQGQGHRRAPHQRRDFSPMLRRKTAAQPVTRLQQQYDASQAAAAATVRKMASFQSARRLDTALGTEARPTAYLPFRPAGVRVRRRLQHRLLPVNPRMTIRRRRDGLSAGHCWPAGTTIMPQALRR